MRLGVLTLLLASGAIAVAGFSVINPKAVPIRQLVESVTNLTLDTQINSLSRDKLRLYRTASSRASDTAESMLSRLGISDKNAADFMRSNALVRDGLLGKNNRQLKIKLKFQKFFCLATNIQSLFDCHDAHNPPSPL